MLSLHDALWNLTVDDLKLRLSLLDADAKSQRKADLIDALKASLTGDGVKRQWDRLTGLEQAAVAEACHAPDLLHQEARFEAKYGNLPAFSEPSGDGLPSYGWEKKNPTRLTLFLYSERYARVIQVPQDLAEALRSFVPEPAAVRISILDGPKEEDGLIVRSTEGDALAEIMALLRLAEQGNLSATAKTGMPTAAGRKCISECLSGGDFFPEEISSPPDRKSWQQVIGDIKPVGWIRLLQSAGYLDSGKSRSKLTPAGIKALTKPSAQIIRDLWKSWLTTKTFDEFNRIEVIKGQTSKGHMTAKPPRRQAVVDALSECPPGEWIDLRQFSSFMLAEGFDFEITQDPWKLYLFDQQYGSFGYDGYGGWDVLQLRYLQVFLFEYAATLGLVDIAFVHPAGALQNYDDQWGADDLEWLSRYDGLRCFRITGLGAYCLGMHAGFEPKKPESSLKISVSEDLTIRLPSSPLLPADRLLLETWAEPIAANTWRLDPVRSRDAIERGQSIEDFEAILRNADGNPLEKKVTRFFEIVKSDATAFRSLGDATLFDCRDAETAVTILAEKGFKNLCYRCGETKLVIPAAQLTKFQKKVRSMGFGIV